MGKWISVKERLPELNLNWSDKNDEVIGMYANVLIFSPDEWAVRSGSYEKFVGDKKGGWVDCDGTKAENITHWQPLPEPPDGR